MRRRPALERPEPVIEVEPYRLFGRFGPRIVGGTERALEAVRLSAAVAKANAAATVEWGTCVEPGCDSRIDLARGPRCTACHKQYLHKRGKP